MVTGRDEKGRFAPGNNGGPGRPAGEFSPTALLRVELEKRPKVIMRLLDLAESEDENVAIKALSYLLNRIEGMPKQATELSGPDKGPVQLSWADGDPA